MSKISMLGKRFGRLTVIAEGGIAKNRSAMWICRCDCGNITRPIYGFHLRSGATKSCGCFIGESVASRNKIHGQHNTRLYNIWRGMKQRCYYEKHNRFAYYGGRGITVCDEWRNDYIAFRDWALSHGYSDELTLDRINNSGNYSPENCRWITMKEQASNKRPYKKRKVASA